MWWLAAVNTTRANLRRLVQADSGQDLLEYGILAALIALVAVGAVTTLGAQINTVMWQMIVTNF